MEQIDFVTGKHKHEVEILKTPTVPVYTWSSKPLYFPMINKSLIITQINFKNNY